LSAYPTCTATLAAACARPAGAAEVWFHDMALESASGQPIDLAALKGRLEACFLVVMGKMAESDGYNAQIGLDVFREDPEYQENEKKYEVGAD